jgi:hypothetical protein
MGKRLTNEQKIANLQKEMDGFVDNVIESYAAAGLLISKSEVLDRLNHCPEGLWKVEADRDSFATGYKKNRMQNAVRSFGSAMDRKGQIALTTHFETITTKAVANLKQMQKPRTQRSHQEFLPLS